MNEQLDVIGILKKLISFKSVSKPKETGKVIKWEKEWEDDYIKLPLWIKDFLEEHGINVEILEKNGVKNVVA